MSVSVCLWKVRYRLSFRFSVVLLAMSHRACSRTVSPCAEAVFSGDLSMAGGCGDTQGLC